MRSTALILCMLSVVLTLKAQQTDKYNNPLQKVKLSGYTQVQYQYGEEDEESFSRIGIRRGRVKLSFEEKIVSSVFQLDITEKGVGIKDAYINIKAPFANTNSLRAGVFNRPFGHEIAYSSSMRESTERSYIFRTLFPEERDLGGMLTLQPSSESKLNFIKLQAGLFAGNGIKQETDNRLDFIGHLSAAKTYCSNINIGIGVSYYNGGVYQGTENIYRMQDGSFAVISNSKNIGKYAKREYIGFDGQLSVSSAIGKSTLKGEYIFGAQPGTRSSSKSPNSSSLVTADTYIRNFRGGYVTFSQQLGQLPLSAVFKYDTYDPNTKVSGDNIGLNNTNSADISLNTLGFGMIWEVMQNVRMQAFYEIVAKEKTENISAYTNNNKDNVFTLRLQYKF